MKSHKWISLTLAALLGITLLASPAQALDEQGPATVPYKVTFQDRSLTGGSGRVIIDACYDLVTVSGSPADQTINSVLQAEYQKFLETDYSEALEIIREDETFYDVTTAQVLYNDKGLFSVLLSYDWYMGGVTDYGGTGCTFDLSTGEQLDIGDLFPKKDQKELLRKLKSTVVDVVRRNYAPDDPNLVDDIKNSLNKSYNTLEALPYYISPEGEVVLYFSKYAIAYGAAGDFTIPTGLIVRPGVPSSTDMPHPWAQRDVKEAISSKLVPAELRSRYTDSITRGEFCVLTTQLYDAVKGSSTGAEINASIAKMEKLGVINGVGHGHFAATSTLTREQAATILSRLAKELGEPLPTMTPDFDDSGVISGWARDAVGQMERSGIMGGMGGNQFNPKEPYTREQSILTILRLYKLVK